MGRFEPGNARDMVKDGTWFRDAQGRYALLRGVNFAGRSKLPPYLPIVPLEVRDLSKESIDRFHLELESMQPELDRMKQLGFNIARVPVMWKAIEPTPNANLEQLLPEGEQYLTLLKEVIDALFVRGLYVIIDFHQDIAHEVYGGDGFPDWALAIDEMHERPSPPSDLRDTKWGLHYYNTAWTKWDVLVRHTLQSFWHNHLRNIELSEHDLIMNTAQAVRTHLEKTIGATARFFQALNGGRGHPAILGYELFNEPHPVGIPKEEFEKQVLPAYYTNVLREIRRSSLSGGPGDAKAFVFVEPRMDWTTYAKNGPEFDAFKFTHTPETDLDISGLSTEQERLVFAFHYYDPWLFADPPFSRNMHDKVTEWPLTFATMSNAWTSRNLIPFLTEFGCSHDWQNHTDLRPDIYQHRVIRASIDLQFQEVEAHLLNATYWQYDLYNTQSNKDNWNLENFSLLGPGRSPRHLDIVARPYPMLSSAQPHLLFFDLASKHCAIILQGPVVDATSVIYIPQSMHYGDGFEVRATSPGLLWDDANQCLYWLPDVSRELNQIVLCPSQAFDEAALPQESRDLLPSTPLRAVPPLAQIEIMNVIFNPAGPDLVGEHVLIQNTGDSAVQLTNWRLQDFASHPHTPPFTFTFPAFTLAAGTEVRVWTKSGSNDSSNLYWRQTKPIWNNTGDTAILRDNLGVEVSRYSYPSYISVPPPHLKVLITDETITVPESSADVDTGIDVAPGDDYALDGSGSIYAGVIATGWNGPAGWINVDHDSKFPLHSGPDAHPYSLIGKFGANGAYFYVGTGLARTRYVDPISQRLFLRTNDDRPGNGKGTFTCRIRIWR